MERKECEWRRSRKVETDGRENKEEEEEEEVKVTGKVGRGEESNIIRMKKY